MSKILPAEARKLIEEEPTLKALASVLPWAGYAEMASTFGHKPDGHTLWIQDHKKYIYYQLDGYNFYFETLTC